MAIDVVAPMPGTIKEIIVKAGDAVKEDEELVILEAMKMENAIPSPQAGRVTEIKVQKGDTVATKQVLVVLE